MNNQEQELPDFQTPTKNKRGQLHVAFGEDNTEEQIHMLCQQFMVDCLHHTINLDQMYDGIQEGDVQIMFLDDQCYKMSFRGTELGKIRLNMVHNTLTYYENGEARKRFKT